MGKDWEIPSVLVWKECFRVLKPGRLLLSFAGTRTVDLISLGIQAAGFRKLGELLWVHGQGFPKGGNVSKAIDKLKGVTPTIVGPDPEAKRRNKKSPRFNGQDYANGTVWQGATDVPLTEPATEEALLWEGWGTQLKPAWEPILVFSKGEPERSIDFTTPFFYCSKASKSETTLKGEIENDHPTKKPLKLMRHLVRLASRPGELVLDPYLGSGTTAEACVHEGVSFVGIEKDPKFHAIASRRLAFVRAEVNSLQGQRDVLDLALSLGDDPEVW